MQVKIVINYENSVLQTYMKRVRTATEYEQ